MTIGKKQAGGAVRTTLSSLMTPSSPSAGQNFDVASVTGWPTSGQFVAYLSPGNADFEKVLVEATGGNAFEVVERGYDGTSAQNHGTGITVEHRLDALTVQALIDHVDGTGTEGADPHSTKLLNNTRHDTTTRHTMGTVVPTSSATPTTITPDAAGTAGAANAAALADHGHPISTGSATTITGVNAEGTGNDFARALHDHALGTGVVGTTQLATAAVTKAKIAPDLRFTTALVQAVTSGTTVEATGTYEQQATRSITLATAGILVVVVEASIQSGGTTGAYDWRARVQVDNADHPTNASLGIIDGWMIVGGDLNQASHYLSQPVFWPLAAGTYDVDFDIQLAGASAGDMTVRDPKIKLYPLEFS